MIDGPIGEIGARVDVEHIGRFTIARLSGEIDLSNAAHVEKELILGRGVAEAVVLDLGGLAYLDSAGLAMLDRVHRAIAQLGNELHLVAPPGSIARSTLTLARFGGLPIFESVGALEDAVTHG